MNNLNKIKTKRGDIALFTVLILAIVMMALLFNISIKTNVDIRTSRDTNLSQQAYNKAIKGAEAWIECASDPLLVDLNDCTSSLDPKGDLVENACSQEPNNGVISDCLDGDAPTDPVLLTYDSSVPSITVKAKARNVNTQKTVNRVVTVEFSN